MSNILIKYNNDLTIEENNKLLEQAVQMLKNNGINCLGFLTVEEAYYHNEIGTALNILRDNHKDELKVIEIINKLDTEEGYDELIENMVQYENIQPFDYVLSEIEDKVLAEYYSIVYTDSYLAEEEITYNAEIVKFKDLEQTERDLIRNQLIGFKVNTNNAHINKVIVDTDVFGLNIRVK